MESKTYDGVRFSVYPLDHMPPHVHGTSGGVIVIVDLLADNEIKLSERWDAIVPGNASRNVTAKILRVATENASELFELWEKAHVTG